MRSPTKHLTPVIFAALLGQALAQVTPNDGDWTSQSETLTNTAEADLMVRSGDIDNLGFGWPTGFSPFTGASTPSHGFPWTPLPVDASGTDRIMVVSSYTSRPANDRDGYTNTTVRPDNSVTPLVLDYALGGTTVNDASLMLFVDDFQAPTWGASYQVKLNGKRLPELEAILNQVIQTGPRGKLVTVQVPTNLLPEVETGQLVLGIDDPTTGSGDGFAIDFVKLLINRKAGIPSGTVSGTVVDSSSGAPLEGATVSAYGLTATTLGDGTFSLSGIPAGFASLRASAPDYFSRFTFVDLLAGGTVTGVQFQLGQGSIDLLIKTAVELSFPTEVGGLYELQWSADDSNWIPDETVAGTGETEVFYRAVDSARKFWRVLVL